MKKVVFLIVLFLSLFLNNKVLASNYIPVDFSISTSGVLTFPAIAHSSIYGEGLYKNGYPATSNIINVHNTSVVYSGYMPTLENFMGSVTTDGIYWFKYTQYGSPYSANWDNDVYYIQVYRSSGAWFSSGVVYGIRSVTAPTSGLQSTSLITFSGTFANSAQYDQLIALVNNYKLGRTSPISWTLPLMSGYDMPFSFTRQLNTLTEYGVRFHLYNSMTGAISTDTNEILFNTPSTVGGIGSGGTDFVPRDCAWSNTSTWGGCFTNLFYAILFPSSDSINQFSNLFDLYKNKPPFGYISAIIEQLKGVNDTGSSVFTLHSLGILNTLIFDPLRSALIWVLWVGFAFVFYNRLKNIQL